MKPTWVVVVEAGRARIFEMQGLDHPMREIEDLVNPEMRVPEHEIGTDRPGRTFDSKGRGRHAMEPATDPSRQKQMKFVQRIAARMEQGRGAEACRDFVLIAAPATLGLLRKALTKTAQRQVRREIPKNVVREDENTIRNLLRG